MRTTHQGTSCTPAQHKKSFAAYHFLSLSRFLYSRLGLPTLSLSLSSNLRFSLSLCLILCSLLIQSLCNCACVFVNGCREDRAWRSVEEQGPVRTAPAQGAVQSGGGPPAQAPPHFYRRRLLLLHIPALASALS